MADRYLKATGNWNNNNTWSATDGGAAGASFPTSSDSVHFTANSNGLTLTVNVSSNCINFVADEANTATVAGASNITVTGNVTLHANMTWSHTGVLFCVDTAGNKTLTSAGKTFGGQVWFSGAGGGYTLQDDLSCGTNSFVPYRGTINTNGQMVTCGNFALLDANAKTITLGSSIINCTSWTYSGSNLTVTANTSTINVTGTGNFTGGSITTYHHVNLNGTAHTILGDNTIEKLRLAAGSTITITPASTQTIRALRTLSTAASPTIIQTGGAAATIQSHRGYCGLNHVNLTSIVAGEKYKYYAGDNSTDGTGNTNWIFTHNSRRGSRRWVGRHR
uniref:Uncharacterized protein n=1 Tax=viral metagenome TaxID=1070528 RepID=A0A6M3IQ43_9ZZZZ